MRSAISTLSFAVSLSAAGASLGGELVVGFESGVALQAGDATTLATSAGPVLGPVSAIANDAAGRVFVAASSLIHRLTPDNSSVAAVFAPPHDVAALACDGGGLFVAAQDGTITEIDPDTGAFVRSTHLGAPLNAMIADGGRLYVAASGGPIWSAATSDLSWKLETTVLNPGATALAARGSNLLVATPGHVFVFERDSGALIYGYNVPNDAAALALEGNDVVVGGNDGSLYRVDPGVGTVWVAQSFSENGSPSPITALTVVDAKPFASLKAQKTWVSSSTPSSVPFRLETSDSIGHLPYFMLGSVTGTKPGVSVAGQHVPLNLDPYFALCLAGNPLLLGGIGAFSDLNAFAVPMADATFSLPTGVPPSAIGLVILHAYVVFDPALGAVRAVSNPAGIVITS